MRTGVFLFGGVEMPDAGAGPPQPTDRRSGPAEVWRAIESLLAVGEASERLGYDILWLTEHHFQHEGYEVVPNGILFAATLAERTRRIRIGTMFNIVPQWHPLKLAEDFAYLHNISGGRGIFGVGRGTVPREAETLGSRIGSFDNPDQADADALNREQFDEGIEVIRAAFDNETFKFGGKHFTYPPPGIPDRGGQVEQLTLVPRPLHPIEWWQAITSPPTLEAVPAKEFGGVFWLKNHRFTRQWWERFAERWTECHGGELAPGDKRMLVLNVRVEDTHERAWETARAGHDEFWKFLGPYGWSRGYMGPDGRPAPAGLIPTLEDSVENRTWIIGTADEVAEGIDAYRRELGGLVDLCLFPNFPGDPYAHTEEQLARYAEQVRPLLG
jgi:alkanesulfonate monooxygenase SsuD/methylene tetrahydromethanopterin reductase-like flavin-dependent oxidoreductase (luciferase family)